MQIRKATKTALPVKICMTGVSGSGKTMSALKIAKGLTKGGKILVIDTECRSSELYADHFTFDVLDIEAPYTLNKYLAAMQMGLENKYDCVIIDSASHAWAGKGGLLEKKESLDARGGNSYTNWSGITKEHNNLVDAILSYPINCIVTLRSKTEYVVEQNEKGKSVPKKVGLAPIQRDGFEYEFTVVFDLAMNHEYQVSKDRTSLYDGRMEKITEATGIEIREWLATCKPVALSEPMGQVVEQITKELGATVTHINNSVDKLDEAVKNIPDDVNEQAVYREKNIKAYQTLLTYAIESKQPSLREQIMTIANNSATTQKQKYDLFIELYKQTKGKN